MKDVLGLESGITSLKHFSYSGMCKSALKMEAGVWSEALLTAYQGNAVRIHIVENRNSCKILVGRQQPGTDA